MGPADHGAHRHRAKRALGQNFLVDPNLQRKIVDAIDPRPDDEVMEIGPGTGALTQHLVGRVGRLHLVELDDALAARLEAQTADEPTVSIVHADILTVDPAALLRNPATAKIVGNIPYNITTPILFHLLASVPRPAVIILMIQREVADRILAEPGSKTFGALAVGVQIVADVERLFHVSRNAFRPVPDVESTVIRIRPRNPPPLSQQEEDDVRSLTRIAFGQRRKQFQKILRDALGIHHDQIAYLQDRSAMDLTARPETFAPEYFVRLARILRESNLLAP